MSASSRSSVCDFARPPSLALAYLRLAARALWRPRPASTANLVLPQRTLRLRGVKVELGRLARYRTVCGFEPLPDVPLTYPQVLCSGLQAHLLLTPAFPLSGFGAVHVSSRIEQLRPLSLDDELEMTCTLGPHRTVDRGFELELIAAMSNSSGLAWRATTTVLWRRPHHKPQQAVTPVAACALPHRALWQLPATAGRRYSRVSGDLNPIHLTRLSARLFGYRQPIAHGMWLLARIVATLAREAPPPPRVLEASFLRPVLLPAEAVLAAQTTSSGIDFALLSADGTKAYLEGRLGVLAADHVS